MIDKKSIISDLINLGIEKDDNIFLTIDIGSVGILIKINRQHLTTGKKFFHL